MRKAIALVVSVGLGGCDVVGADKSPASAPSPSVAYANATLCYRAVQIAEMASRLEVMSSDLQSKAKAQLAAAKTVLELTGKKEGIPAVMIQNDLRQATMQEYDDAMLTGTWRRDMNAFCGNSELVK